MTHTSSHNTIALIDNHQIMREGLEYVLLTLGYKVVIRASDGYDLLEQLQQHEAPAICILEMDMPGMNGYQITRHLKKKYQHLRILAYSTENHELAIERMYNCGADAYLEKGVTALSLLKSTIDRLQIADGTKRSLLQAG